MYHDLDSSILFHDRVTIKNRVHETGKRRKVDTMNSLWTSVLLTITNIRALTGQTTRDTLFHGQLAGCRSVGGHSQEDHGLHERSRARQRSLPRDVSWTCWRHYYLVHVPGISGDAFPHVPALRMLR